MNRKMVALAIVLQVNLKFEVEAREQAIASRQSVNLLAIFLRCLYLLFFLQLIFAFILKRTIFVRKFFVSRLIILLILFT